MRLIETNNLVEWAGSYSAKGQFPLLMKKLICAVIEPAKVRMPSGAAVWLPGFDGVVANDQENRFVPVGLSVWELGTGSDIEEKAVTVHGVGQRVGAGCLFQ